MFELGVDPDQYVQSNTSDTSLVQPHWSTSKSQSYCDGGCGPEVGLIGGSSFSEHGLFKTAVSSIAISP